MNNKKYLKIGAAVLLSGILLITAVLTSYASSNAYEEFKRLMREEHVQVDSMTLKMDMVTTDNGETVFRAEGNMKADRDAESTSGQFQISMKGEEKDFEVYRNDDTTLFRLNGSENWYQTTSTESFSDNEDQIPRYIHREDMNNNRQLHETLMDAMIGDLKDQITLVEANGLRTFSLTLDKGNMPVLVQTIFSAADMHDDIKPHDDAVIANLPAELRNEISDMMDNHDLVDISSNKLIEKVKVSLTIDEKNQPQNMDLSMEFSGNAKDGTAHVIEVNCSLALSDINTTVPDEVNVDPSLITIIETEQFENRR